MKPTIITGDDLIAIGFPQTKAIAIALKAANTAFSHFERGDVLAVFTKLLQYPENFLDDETLGPVARALGEEAAKDTEIPLKENAEAYAVFGPENIEAGASDQMNVAMRLPVTVAGALMPDAHQGYGLPIGGVLAARNAIIPYGVGVDIGCRMALTVFDIPAEHLLANNAMYKRELIAFTKFGAGNGYKGREKAEHEVLENPLFRSIPLVKSLHERAYAQLGTSGGGNHFVEWGIMEFEQDDAALNVPKGKYVALLSHSGSRGLGATIAGHYTRLAKTLCQLPKEAANLAYLDMNSEAGQEYWLAMNLAGDFASACHEVIHNKLVKAIGGKVLARVENHHNFAWKEMLNGEEVIVHRKGATPAGKGVMGIIPGSMTAPGFLVPIKTISKNDMRAMLKEHGVTLIGAGLDEAPAAYKDINKVMAAQQDLVDIIAKFTPNI
eukprot:gene10563-10374_t